jgi:hypothetical protein
MVAASTAAYGDAPTATREHADELFAEGRGLIEAHHDAEACVKFGEAIKLDPDAAGTMLNLGLCNEHLKNYRRALYWFRRAQTRAHETNLPDYERAAGEHTTTLAALVATIKIEIAGDAPPEAAVRIDGDEVKPDEYLHVEIDPGHHVLEAAAPGKHGLREEFDVEGKGGQTLTLTFVDLPIERRDHRRTYATISAIAGGALLVTAGIVTVYARIEWDKCVVGGVPTGSAGGASGCPVTTTSDAITYDHDKWRLARWVATPVGAAGLVAGGLATYLFLTHGSATGAEHPDRTSVNVLPSIAPDQLGLVVGGAF